MGYTNNLVVLIADDDAAFREMAAEILKSHGYKVLQAQDGGAGITVVEENHVDIALVGYQMTPRSGFDFARHLLIKNINIGVIMITADVTTDLLLEAGKFEIKQLMRKPVDPDKLVETVRRVLRATGRNPDAVAGDVTAVFTPDDHMKRAIALAHQNARAKLGGPYGAVVADAEGRIVGEGVNGVTTRCDPTAHAEVMAIRRATERLGRTDLTGCTVYCSSEPTMLGQALIISTGISKVYYGLSHEDIGFVRAKEDALLAEIEKPLSQRAVPYEQRQHKAAQDMFDAWKAQKSRVED